MALTDKLSAIGEAIRAKTGKSDKLTLDQMPGEIASITGGGGGSSADVRYVTFMNGDTVLYKKPVAVGDDCVDVVVKGLVSTPTKESTAQYNYTYYGWGASDGGAADANILKSITEDKTVYAIYTSTVRSYTITWLNDDGSVMKTETLTYGTMPSYTPTKTDYNFKGWSPAVSTVTGNATYTAVWEAKVYYTITFYDDDGVTVLETQVVEQGKMPSYTPTKNGAVFFGWDSEITAATANASYTAQWQYVGITYTWSEISEMSAAGTGANYMAIGDCKAVYLKGTMGTLALDTTLFVYILGFNHNSAVEGQGIQFGGFKQEATNGKDVCLVDGQGSNTKGQMFFNLNHWGFTTSGGWACCDLRYDILGSTNVAPSGYGAKHTATDVGYDATATCATSPVANTLMSCLPSDLRAVMKPITKWSDNVGGAAAESNVKASVDYLPLLAEFEVFGSRSYANPYEQNHQQQYAYFAAGNSTVKYNHTSIDSTAQWWLRSAEGGSSFCFVKGDGANSSTFCHFSYGIAPVFMV